MMNDEKRREEFVKLFIAALPVAFECEFWALEVTEGDEPQFVSPYGVTNVAFTMAERMRQDIDNVFGVSRAKASGGKPPRA
jgi:hypothetical protein